jgi:hypothetical protein
MKKTGRKKITRSIALSPHILNWILKAAEARKRSVSNFFEILATNEARKEGVDL